MNNQRKIKISRFLTISIIVFILVNIVIYIYLFSSGRIYEAIYLAREAPSREEIKSMCPGKSKEEIDSIYNVRVQECIKRMNERKKNKE